MSGADTVPSGERTLAYLSTVPVQKVKGLSGKRGKDLAEAGVGSVADLLMHAPRRYIDRSTEAKLSDVPIGQEVTVIASVQKVSTRRPRRNLVIVEAQMTDGTAPLKAVWFNQAFRARQLSEGAEVALSGKVERFRGRLQMKSPAVDVLRSGSESLTTGRIVPIHPGVGDASPGYLRRAMHNALQRARPIADPLSDDVLDRLDLMSRDPAFSAIHFPESLAEVGPARRRLVYDEFFRLEVALALKKRWNASQATGIVHRVDGPLVHDFVAGLPYDLTGAQERVIDEIAADMASSDPMHRLLQGEVGSGKTVVAIAALLTGVQGGYQGAVMAPTEVLAEQHFLGMSDVLDSAGLRPTGVPDDRGMVSLFDAALEEADQGGDRPQVRVGLLTSNNARVNYADDVGRVELIEQISAGNIDVVVGTHALIQEGVEFARLGVAVVDEQHRFGVHQRVQLRDKGAGVEPDLLIMTATPIPRTLSMTLYGDLDVSILDELPPGRTPIETWSVSGTGPELERVYRLVRSEISRGRQAYVVCPLVEDSAKIEASSAVAEHARLSDVFSDLSVGLLHGQMRPSEKDEVMSAFRAGEIDVLVATTVIEVGIDVPNATVMVIEDADRFGLSQLHQLRGRVGRGAHASQCVLIADPSTDDGVARIAAMVSTTDGFRLAEEDLRIRGQGTVFGARQSGMSDLRIGDILTDAETLIVARREAFDLVGRDPRLEDHPAVREEVRALLGDDVEWLLIS